MNALGTPGLVAAYVVVAATLLVLAMYARIAWRAKLALVVVTSASYIACYYALPPLLGWPTDSPLPRRFAINAVYVQEPDQITGATGEVFFWVQDLTGGAPTQRPRAYRVDWTPEYRALAVEAGTKLKKNIPQIGELLEEEDLGRIGRPGEDSVQVMKSQRSKVKIKDSAPLGPPPKGSDEDAAANPGDAG